LGGKKLEDYSIPLLRKVVFLISDFFIVDDISTSGGDYLGPIISKVCERYNLLSEVVLSEW
jgi:hypothetical protein